MCIYIYIYIKIITNIIMMCTDIHILILMMIITKIV